MKITNAQCSEIKGARKDFEIDLVHSMGMSTHEFHIRVYYDKLSLARIKFYNKLEKILKKD